MDREIKFRGLRKDGKGWIYGSIVYPDKLIIGVWMLPEVNICDFYPELEDGEKIESHEHQGIIIGRFIEVIPETVGQYTGLKDKKSVEIYEGDIVVCNKATEPEDLGFICQFKDYRWKFNNVRFPDDDFYGTVNYNYIIEDCEVTGNIHQP